jgi:iron complex transport system substrate-binding protein
VLRCSRHPLGFGLAIAARLVIVVSASLAACGREGQAPPGVEGAHTVAPVARRIVSLNPSLTAILLALGARDVMVGVDDFSAHQQPAVADLPRVGGLYNPSLESVVALEPDLVVLVPSAEQRGFRERLAELAIPSLVLDPVAFDDVLASIEALGGRVGLEREARERVSRIRAARSAVETATAALTRPRTVLVLQRDPLFVVGRGSFVDEMLTAAGAANLARDFDEAWPRVSREWLLAAAPELILDSSSDPEAAASFWSRWPSLPAVREGRVVAVPEGATTLPGPYLDRALVMLAEAIHPGETLGEDLGVTPEGTGR